MSGFDISTFGAERTEIQDASGNTAAVIHRPVNVHWRQKWGRLEERLGFDRPAPPPELEEVGRMRPLRDDANDEERESRVEALKRLSAAADAYARDVAAWEKRTRPERVREARALLGDLVVRFEGVTIDGQEVPAAQVLDIMRDSGGDDDRGLMLLNLAAEVIRSSVVGPDEEKD